MSDPRKYQFNLPKKGRPSRIGLEEEWYPEIHKYYGKCTSKRIYHPINGIRAVVIHATAGGSSVGAASVIKAGRASFHWLVPDEDEPQHGHFIWATAPEKLAAWHVRNSTSHPDVFDGHNKVNHFSLGIEVVNTQKSSDEFSDWQIQTTARIVRYCWAKYPNLKHVVSHAKLDPRRRKDPGTNFPWQDFKKLVLVGDEDPVPKLVSIATPASQIKETDFHGNCTG